MRAAARELDVVDRGGGRRVHRGPVPRLGGVAVLLAGAGALAAAPALGVGVVDLLEASGWNLRWLGAGALVVLVLGVVDDVRGVRPAAKLALQTLAALIALRGGYGFGAVTNPFTGGVIALAPFGGVLTVLWIVGITNAFNLIDGPDGVAAAAFLGLRRLGYPLR